MEFEADRMTGLTLTDDIVAPERDVVLEERRMHCDTDPGAQLGEAVQATLFTHHPYGIPVIGWGHEIEGLKREDALAYYKRFYTPENAILVVAGDVEPEEARALAEETYGKIKPRGAKPERVRPIEPPTVASRLVTVADDKVEQPGWQRHYLAPPPAPRSAGEAEALEVLGHLLGGGQTSLLYRDAGDGGEARRLGLGLLPRHGARPEPVHRQHDAGARRYARDARQGVRPGARRSSCTRASTPATSSAPRRGSSPTRSTPATASRTSRAGTARRWRSARRSATSRNGRRGSRR